MDYQRDLRVYDNCVDRVERSTEVYMFNNLLVRIIEREFPERPDISTELRQALVEPLRMSSCISEPDLFQEFPNN